MKKFLIFLVSIIVVVSFGLTTYYFIRNDEVIQVNTKELYCNAGDIISLESLNITVKKPYRKTTFNYNAGGEEVTSKVNYDASTGYYVVDQKAGGVVDLIISTTNKKFPEFKVTLHIGNGEEESPYYIFNESTLNKIGATYKLDANYSLMNNITLTNSFKPIGYRSYEDGTGEWQGFSGKFNGNGYTISGLNLAAEDYEDAGLFSKLNAGSVVENLTIDAATISGAYSNAGALAGVAYGDISKVTVKNVNITNAKDGACVGGLAGEYANGNVKMSCVDGANISVTGADVKVGGFAGKLGQVTANATYANGSIKETEATGVFGGYAGEFVIGTNAGSIMQSYSNITSVQDGYGAFVGKVSTAEDFDASKSNMLKHFIGNIAIVNTDEDITDSDVVAEYNAEYFNNDGKSVFFNEASALYLIRGYQRPVLAAENEFVFYAIDTSAEGKTFWDTNYVWKTYAGSMPTLIMGSIEPTGVNGEYFKKDLAKEEINSTNAKFEDIFSSNVENKQLSIVEDVDLSAGWTPVSLTNCVVDGNNKTIKINLNTAVDNCLGLFAKLDDCTIKNLNIEVVGISANAAKIGALAGEITSTADTYSTITNVNVVYSCETNVTATQFGGLVGSADNTNINSVTVEGLAINADANIDNVGGVVATLNGRIEKAEVGVTLYGKTNVGGVVANLNSGAITNVNANVVVGYNKTDVNAQVGGLVAINHGTISDANAVVDIKITNSNQSIYVGGVAATNSGIINSTSISGNGIALGTDSAALTGDVYVGGVAAVNHNQINSTYNTMATVGTFAASANYRVGGVVSVNNGNIYQVLTSSNLYGNYVGGVAVNMKNSTSNTVTEVVVGAYDKETGALTENVISGDKYVAGLIVDFELGSVSDVQLISALEGKASNTKTSLLVLVFPHGATVNNATVNSTLTGYGKFYRDAWNDYQTTANGAELGFSGIKDGTFDVYKNLNSGSMTSVVINSKYDDAVSAKASMANVSGTLFDLIPTSDNYDEVSFIKETSVFDDKNEFAGDFEFRYAYNSMYNSYRTTTKTLTFNFGEGGVWNANNGISLNFLKDVK